MLDFTQQHQKCCNNSCCFFLLKNRYVPSFSLLVIPVFVIFFYLLFIYFLFINFSGINIKILLKRDIRMPGGIDLSSYLFSSPKMEKKHSFSPQRYNNKCYWPLCHLINCHQGKVSHANACIRVASFLNRMQAKASLKAARSFKSHATNNQGCY